MISLLLFLAHQAAPLHPAFAIDEATLKAAYEKGVQDSKAKMKGESVLRQWTKDVGTVRSPRGMSWTAPYAVLQTPAEIAEFEGYKNTHEYVDGWDAFYKNFEGYQTHPDAKRKIYFAVRLYAWPGILNKYGHVNRLADPKDVRDVKFVLLIDDEKPIHPLVRPTEQSDLVMNGSINIPEYHTIYGSSSTTDSAYARNRRGDWAWAYGSSSTSSTVSYTTTRVEDYECYVGDYYLEFPMRDPEGKPYVTPDTKRIVLKIVRWNGEHTGDFKLADFMPPKPKK